MRRYLSVLEVLDKILMSIVIAFLAIALAQPVLAKDAGITIQTTRSSSYAGTKPLSKRILNLVKANVNTDDKSRIRKVLSQLRDGDILVLAVHSNPSVFAIGDETVQWGRFWQYFGIEKPPKLATVIIGGCMARQYEQNGEKHYVDVTDPEAEFIRRNLNTWTLFSPKSIIHAWTAVSDAEYCLRSILPGTNLSEIDLKGKWHLVTDPKLDPDKISLFELRVIGKQLFQESDIDYLVPAIPPTEVTRKWVSEPPTLEKIQDRDSEVWGAWGATGYSGSWDFGPEEYDDALVNSWIVTFTRPERAKEFFESRVRNRKAYFAQENPHRKGQIHEEPNRVAVFFPVDNNNIGLGEDYIMLLYNKNTFINVSSLYLHFTVKEKVSKIVKEMETGAMLAVDHALERAEVQLKGE